jgi:hypothetical protein
MKEKINMKKKLLAKIFIPIIALGILVAPISSGLTTKKAEAYNADPAVPFNSNVFAGSSLSQRNIGPTSVGLHISITADTQGKDWYQTDFFDCTTATTGDGCQEWKFRPKSIGVVIFKDGVVVSGDDLSPDLYKYFVTQWDPNWAAWYNPEQLYGNLSGFMNQKLLKLTGFQGDRDITTNLEPETEYTAQLYFRANNAGLATGSGEELQILDPSPGKRYFKIGNALPFKTLKANESIIGDTLPTEDVYSTELNLGCTLGEDFKLEGCIAQFFLIVWEVSAKIMELAGKLLDFFMFYSLNSSAYTSAFIQEGWGIIRDVANIFFILVLLYIAIKTILNLNVSNNKKLIGAVIIVALIINFSLFFTQVVIDSSNILAKVFYTKITSTNADGTTTEEGSGGEKAIAVKLVSGFNPQSIIKTNDDLESIGRGMYIFIILIMIFLTLYCAYMFFVVSILFIGRVVSLWIAMIFAPFAFLSYAVPSDKIPFNHKQWWKDLLESAFMAPIFLFFLYIIILFIKLGRDAAISYGSNTSPDTMIKIMGVIIPFAIIFLMLTRAKKLAVSFSGELGAMLSKIGGMATSFVGGGVVGFAAGALAKGGRATIGRAGSALANSAGVKNLASSKWAIPKFFGNKLMDAGKATSKASFDARGLSVAGKTLASTGLKVGQGKKGGFEQTKKEQIEKRQKRAQELEVGYGEKERKALVQLESNKQDVLSKLSGEIDKLDKTIDKSRQAETDARNRLTVLQKTGVSTNSQEYKDAQEELKKASNKLFYAKEHKKKLTKGEDYTEKDENGNNKKDANGNDIIHKYSETAIYKNKDGTTTSLEQFDTELIPDANNKLKALNAKRRLGYAKGMDKFLGKTTSLIFSGGEYSSVGDNEAAYKIRMDQKLDTGTKV